MSGSGKMQYNTNDGKKEEDEPMIDPHNLDYFLEQDTNPSLFQEKEDLENCFHHPQSFEIGTLLLSTTTACATTRTADHQHRPETTTTGGETSQASYQETP